MSESTLTNKTAVDQAANLMNKFAQRTGLTSNAHPVRYLWTDAFAVCNFLALAEAVGDGKYLDLAGRLVNQVHETLGRHREDDSRTGRISGLSDEQGRIHPTSGGLRIGKPHPERGSDEPFDESLEWDSDGQYFHYLTRWMQALDAVARETGEPHYATWAAQLAGSAGKAFVYRGQTGELKMYWKMSIDLSRPLVLSTGPHDPLDGYITVLQLRSTFKEMNKSDSKSSPGNELKLDEVLGAFGEMIRGRDWTTADPLGLGVLLINAVRLMQLNYRGDVADPELLKAVLRSVQTGLIYWVDSGDLAQPALHRLAFRELGLAIGLGNLRIMRDAVRADNGIEFELNVLGKFSRLENDILSFWADTSNHSSPAWNEHKDINEVMLASALLIHSFSVSLLL